MSSRLSRLAGASVLLLATGVGRALPAQPTAQPTAPLSLADALREADRRAIANRVASAASRADRAQARLPLQGMLPTARIDAGVVRTSDPIGAFGTTLRQRSVTAAAFDPARLNNPDAITNVQGALVLEMPLLNGDAWTGWRAARAAADARDAAGDWTSTSVRADVIRAYYGAVLAAVKVETLEQAQRAADAAVRQVQSMVQQGLVTRADALQASVRATDVASQLIAARSDALTARQQLGLLIGRVDGATPTLPTAFPADALVQALAARDTTSTRESPVADRADVRAARAGVRAAEADRQRAMPTLAPRLNGFARYDWNDPTHLYAGRKNWTVGVMASWSLFGGGRELADVAASEARLAGARAGADGAAAAGQLDADAARRALIVALQRRDFADRVVDQAREAYRLVDKRYAGGLATIAELLGAEAGATQAALAQVAARFAVIDALAANRRARGDDLADLVALDGTH